MREIFICFEINTIYFFLDSFIHSRIFKQVPSTSLTYVVIFQLHQHIVCIYRRLFVMQELVRHTISLQFETVY
jgi:hypothetical protein